MWAGLGHPTCPTIGADAVAERLGDGLQSRSRQFESGRRLDLGAVVSSQRLSIPHRPHRCGRGAGPPPYKLLVEWKG